MIRLTAHALERAVERIPGCTCEADARVMLSAAIFDAAAFFAAGCTCYVRLGTGNRIVIADGAVITVLPIDNYRRTVRRYKRARFA